MLVPEEGAVQLAVKSVEVPSDDADLLTEQLLPLDNFAVAEDMPTPFPFTEKLLPQATGCEGVTETEPELTKGLSEVQPPRFLICVFVVPLFKLPFTFVLPAP